MPENWFVFDVESVGLHGDAFAVGWVVIDGGGTVLSATYESCDPSLCAAGSKHDRQWVAANVPPLSVTTVNPQHLRASFWLAWRVARSRWPGIAMAADVPWPVEARFLLECIRDDPARQKEAPYPLYDVSMFLPDPLATHERLPNELPAHHPLNDARQSARLLITALRLRDADD